MLVDVYLHGELGKKFGRKWSVAARGPSHALRLINANTSSSLVNWLREKQPNSLITAFYANSRWNQASII